VQRDIVWNLDNWKTKLRFNGGHIWADIEFAPTDWL